MTIPTKLSRVDAINKEGTCTPALQRQGLKTSANDNGEEERARDKKSGNHIRGCIYHGSVHKIRGPIHGDFFN